MIVFQTPLKLEIMKRPSFQFYPMDWLSDHNVIAMTAAQRGGYIHLLCCMWNTDDCTLENDDELLCRLAGITEEDLRVVKGCFKLVDGKTQVITHKRLSAERAKQDEWQKKSRKGGLKSAEKRRKKANKSTSKGGSKMVDTNEQPMGNTSSSSSSKKKIDKLSSSIFSEDTFPFQLSKLLFTQIVRAGDPKAKEPNLQSWAVHVDRMIRIDGRTPEEIEALIYWVSQDDFWKTNILSTLKLRKQFSRLWAKAKANVEQRQRQSIKSF